MSVSVLVCEYGGAVMSRCVRQNINEFLRRLDSRKEYPMLGYVDLYGDTIFNSRQVGVVLEELRSASRSFEDGEMTPMIQELIELAELVPLRPHRKLIFSGD
ncbi:hypothetical protein [Nocardiopsis sp. CA-288880]|uniref:hypothetical protein n=1 Tax=Nocardiopsis sp. CA-288880 TaxID=3239995 RepID=UPI003D95956E